MAQQTIEIAESTTAVYTTVAKKRRTRKTIETIDKLRELLTQGKSQDEIMTELHLSRSSFYRYLRLMLSRDSKLLESQDADMLSLQIATLMDRLNGVVARSIKIAENESIDPLVRLKAEEVIAEISVALVKLRLEGSAIVKDVIRRHAA